MGWEVKVVRSDTKSGRVKVQYLHAVDSKQRPYERWMRRDQLRDLPVQPGYDDQAIFAVCQDSCVLRALQSRLSAYAPSAWLRVLDCSMPSHDGGPTLDLQSGVCTTVSADCALVCGDIVCLRVDIILNVFQRAAPLPFPPSKS